MTDGTHRNAGRSAEPGRARRQNRRRNRPQRVPGAVKSPCIGVCTLDEATGFCQGCHRSLEEIRDWMILDDDDRRAIMAKVVVRRGVVAG